MDLMRTDVYTHVYLMESLERMIGKGGVMRVAALVKGTPE